MSVLRSLSRWALSLWGQTSRRARSVFSFLDRAPTESWRNEREPDRHRGARGAARSGVLEVGDERVSALEGALRLVGPDRGGDSGQKAFAAGRARSSCGAPAGDHLPKTATSPERSVTFVGSGAHFPQQRCRRPRSACRWRAGTPASWPRRRAEARICSARRAADARRIASRRGAAASDVVPTATSAAWWDGAGDGGDIVDQGRSDVAHGADHRTDSSATVRQRVSSQNAQRSARLPPPRGRRSRRRRRARPDPAGARPICAPRAGPGRAGATRSRCRASRAARSRRRRSAAAALSRPVITPIVLGGSLRGSARCGSKAFGVQPAAQQRHRAIRSPSPARRMCEARNANEARPQAHPGSSRVRHRRRPRHHHAAPPRQAEPLELVVPDRAAQGTVGIAQLEVGLRAADQKFVTSPITSTDGRCRRKSRSSFASPTGNGPGSSGSFRSGGAAASPIPRQRVCESARRYAKGVRIWLPRMGDARVGDEVGGQIPSSGGVCRVFVPWAQQDAGR